MILLALWSLRALATILLGGLIVLALRRRSAAVRSLALRLTLVAAWLLPLAVFIAPRIEIAVPKSAPVTAPLPSSPPAVNPKLDMAPAKVTPVMEVGPTSAHVEVVAATSPSVDSVALLPFAYAIGVFGLTIRWLAGMLRLRRIASKGERLTPHVIRVPEVGVPATYGLLRPAVLLPAASAEWPEARVQAAILHEEAHIRRRDWLWQTLANLFATIHWFNPAAWLLARALRDTAEAATDDEVLAGGFVPTAYARELLAVAAQARSAGPALAMARRGGVSDRVTAILLANRDRRRPTLPAVMTMTLLFLGVGLVVGSIAEARAAQSKSLSSVSLPSGVTVTIDRVRDYGKKQGLAWKADGSLLPETVGANDYMPKSDLLTQRNVALEVSVTGAPNPSAILLAPQEAPVFQRLPSGNDRSRARFMFLWRVPVDESEQLVRLGIASGAWQPYAGPAFNYRLGKTRGTVPAGVVSSVPDKHIVADYIQENSRMPPNPRTSIGFNVPRAMAGHEVRVNALDPQGRLLGQTTVSFGPPLAGRAYSASTVFYMGLKREKIAKLVFECREYLPVEFPTVAVKPRTAQIKPNEAIEVEAIGLGYPEGKAWRLDGTPDHTLKPPSDRMPTIVGWRRLQVAVRIKGRKLKDPWAQVTLWDKDLMPCRSDTCVLEDVPGSPNEKIAWCSLEVRPEFNVRTMGIDVANGDWRTDADVTPGKGAVLVERVMQPRDPSWRFYYVRFPGRELPGSDRDVSLEVFGGSSNQESTTFMNKVPLHPNGPYDFTINGAGKIKRLVLSSRASQHARAGKVNLWPSDTTRARLADGRTVDLLEFARYGKSPATWSADGNSRVLQPNSFDLRSSVPKGLEAHLRTAGSPVGNSSLSFRISYPSSVTSTHAVSSSPPSFDGFENWFVQFDTPPQGVRTATLSVGIGVGPWEAVNRSVKFSRENYSYLVPQSPDVVTISSEIPRPSADFQVRLVGLDKDGNSLGDWHQAGSFMKNGKLVMVASSEGRRAKRVARVELQQRRIRWTDIPNVAVVPR